MVSIALVVPAYNHEQFIGDCLRSLARQSAHNDCALIVLDDCSVDDTFNEIRDALDDDRFVHNFAQIVIDRNIANCGAASTINRAIRLSSADVIMVINSDDVYFDGRVAACVGAIERGAEFVFTDIEVIGVTSDNEADCEAFAQAIREIPDYPTVSASFVSLNRAISTGNFCFTRSLFERAGGFRDLRYCHDWDFALTCALHVEPAFIPQKLYGYRLHAGNSFRSLSDTATADTRACYGRFFQACVSGGIKNELLREIVGIDALWQALIQDAGPVAVEEWIRAADGLPGRPPSQEHG